MFRRASFWNFQEKCDFNENHDSVRQKIGDAGPKSIRNIFPIHSVTSKTPESPYGAKSCFLAEIRSSDNCLGLRGSGRREMGRARIMDERSEQPRSDICKLHFQLLMDTWSLSSLKLLCLRKSWSCPCQISLH